MTILSTKEAHNKIGLIAKAGKKLDERIHAVALSGIAHYLICGNTDILSDLSLAMPKSGRGNALKFYITKHVPVKWNSKARKGKGGFVKDKARHDVTMENNWYKIAVVMEADNAPFYKKEDTEKAEWNPQASILRLVAKLNKYKQDHSLTLTEESKQALIRAIEVGEHICH